MKALAWSPYHGGILATGGGTNDRCLRLWDVRAAEATSALSDAPRTHATVLACEDSGSQICNVAWSCTSSQLVTTHGFTLNQIILWDVHQGGGSIRRNYGGDSERRGSSNDNTAPDTFTLSKTDVIEAHHARVLFLAMNPTGDIIATAAADETVRFWNAFPTSKIKQRADSPPDAFGETAGRYLRGLL